MAAAKQTKSKRKAASKRPKAALRRRKPTTKAKGVRRASAAKPKVPAEVDRDSFLAWRFPRAGARNPHDLTNPAWVWLARSPELSAYGAGVLMRAPSAWGIGPGFCAMRFGQTRTSLPDGRVVAIGGEHEDHYDPDFFIYNDVFVFAPDGDVRIYGYPYEAFAPTDFHSATLLSDGRILIIGCLGHPSDRVATATPVYSLSTTTFEMTRLETRGDRPGWIYEHAASLSDDGRVVHVTGGRREIVTDGKNELIENVDDWGLDVERGEWTRYTTRGWQEWAVERADGRRSDLFEIGSARWYANDKSPWARAQLAKTMERLGRVPDFALYDARHCPPVPHARVADPEPAYPLVVRNVIEGVTVRYVEGAGTRVVIEGALPDEVVVRVLEDLRGKLATLEAAPYVSRRLQ